MLYDICRLWWEYIYMYLVFLKQRSAHITVERICEVILQVFESHIDIFWFLCILYTHYEEVNEPCQRVLVHGLNVCQISDREKQNRRVHSDRSEKQTLECLYSLQMSSSTESIFWVRQLCYFIIINEMRSKANCILTRRNAARTWNLVF